MDHVRLFWHARGLANRLSALRAAGWKLGVLTNCGVDLFALTQRRFQQPFDLVVAAEHVKDYKPSLAHFHY